MSTEQEVDFFAFTANIVGGLALLLYGISRMSAAVKLMAGDKIKDLLASLSKTAVRGFITGVVGAGMMQSSTAIILLVLNFVSGNLMTFEQSVAICLGAQIGTTFVNQLVAFKLANYALLLLGIGFAFFKFLSHEKVTKVGIFLFGLGVMFHGNELLGASVMPLRHYQPFLDFLAGIQNPLVGTGVSCVFTLLVQASAATISIAQVLSSQGLVSLQTGICIVLGANIGTVGTGLVASIGSNRAAVRVGVCYLLIKLIPAIFTLPLLGVFESLVRGLSSAAADESRLIANAHTIWNIVVSVGLLPLTREICKLMRWLVPDHSAMGRE